MLNNVIVMGRIVADPEIRTLNDGTFVAHFAIACDRDIAKGDEKKVDFFEVVAWRKTAEFIGKYFFKGKPILIQGRLQQRTWADKQTGKKRSAIEILADHVDFCGGDKVNTPQAGPTAVPQAGAVSQQELDDIFTNLDGGDDDLPWAP